MTQLRRTAGLFLVSVLASAAPFHGAHGALSGSRGAAFDAARPGTPAPAAQSRALPSRLNDAAFWKMFETLSEDGGSFPSNNFVSNETEFQTVIPRLSATVKPGGVYVGVGPDQNFTYIAAVRPAIAFIVDIRRQNAMHHLLYKALMELSPTRLDFLARLFARPRPAGLGANAPPAALFEALFEAMPQPDLWAKHLAEVFDRLERHHEFVLTPADRGMIQLVYEAFVSRGPDISYASTPIPASYFMADTRILRGTPYPTFAALMSSATDGDGANRAYLASEANYKIIREMQLRNLIVPVVGDFAGPKAVRGVGEWVGMHRAKVTALYTSNVEQYLFQNGVWRHYYDNVATMPLDDTSTFIRAHFISSGVLIDRILSREMASRIDPFFTPASRAVSRSVSLLCSVRELLAGVAENRVNSYSDVLLMSQ
jgi:hypothetical protein